MHGYMFDNSATAEYQRLDLMSKILDPRTRASLLSLGLTEGWNCLELGGGNGSITEWLCEVVGESGRVASVDINPQLLELIPSQNLSVRKVDARTEDLPAGPFDLVMCRATLHQVSEYAPAVLAKMAAATRPGGWIFVCEPDFNLVRTCEPATWAKAWNGIIEWGHSQGVEWYIGRKLPAMVQALGLGYPEAKTEVPNIRGTTRDALYFQMVFEMIRDRAIESGFVDAPTLEAASKLLADPDAWTQCWMLTSVWIRKPLQ